MSPTRKNSNRPSGDAVPRNRSIWLLAAGAIGLCMGLWAAFYGYRISHVADPPSIETTGVDPAVVEAIEQARLEVIESRRSAEAWGHLGMTLHAHDFTAQAAMCFSEAERFDSQNAIWTYLHARCIRQADPDAAKSLLEKSIIACGDNPETPRLYLVELLLEEQQLDAAEAHLNELLKRNSNKPRARHAKARMYFMREDFQACKDEVLNLQNDIKRKYDAAKLHVQQLMDQGQRKAAAAEARAAQSELRESLCQQKTVGLLLASALRQLGELDNAEKQRQLAIKQSDTAWPDPYAQQVLDLKTGLKTMLSRADVAFGHQRYDESVAILTEAIAKYPDSAFAHILLGRAHIRTGRIAQEKNNDKEVVRRKLLRAGEHLRQALSIDNSLVEAQFRLAVSFVYLAELDGDPGKLKEAESWFRKAIALKPDFAMAYYNLANCLNKQGKQNAAIETLSDAIRYAPNDVQARVAFGTLLMRAGRSEEAKKNLRLALQLDPDNQTAQVLLKRVAENTE